MLREVGMFGNPRINDLVVTAFIGLLYPIKYAILRADYSLQKLGLSNMLLLMNPEMN